MAHKKAGGSTRNGRDSNAKRLGVKRFGGALVNAGEILIRQKGSKFRAGTGVEQGRDFTLFALQNGKVEFSEQAVKRFDGRTYKRKFVNIIPA